MLASIEGLSADKGCADPVYAESFSALRDV